MLRDIPSVDAAAGSVPATAAAASPYKQHQQPQQLRATGDPPVVSKVSN